MKKLTKSRIEWMIRTNQTYRLLKLLINIKQSGGEIGRHALVERAKVIREQ